MDILEQAIAFALKAHEGQTRKREGLPYILHPLEAATIASTLTDDHEVLAAVVLHDTIEDTDTTYDDLLEHFGKRVADLVMHETEDKRPDIPPSESWRIRKEESLSMLRHAEDPGVKVMWMSDKLANMRSFYRMYLTEGDRLWSHFHQKNPAQQEWYYRSIAASLGELSDTNAYNEYKYLMNSVFGGNKS